jgi:hypothetical protein
MHQVTNRTAADRRGSAIALKQNKDLRKSTLAADTPFADAPDQRFRPAGEDTQKPEANPRRRFGALPAPWRPRPYHATLTCNQIEPVPLDPICNLCGW